MEPVLMCIASAIFYYKVAREGLLGEIFKDQVGENSNTVVARILHSLRDALNAGTLPVNHDLRRAGLDSLRKAGLGLAAALGCELDPYLKRKSLTARIKRYLTAAQVIYAGSGPEMVWVRSFVTALKDKTKLTALDDAGLQIGPDSTELLQANVDLALAAKLHEKFAAWVKEYVGDDGKPQCFQQFISDGWPVEQGTLTLYQAYCICFREKLKHDQAVCNIFTGNALTEIKSKLDNLSRRDEVNADEIASRIQKALIQSLDQQLSGLHDTVACGFVQIANQLESLDQQIGGLHSTVTRGFIQIATQLAPSTLPFKNVRDLPYGADEDPRVFIPSLREFEVGLVHRPALADQVRDALIKKRFACVLGKGASGKTTQALLLAFGEPFGPERSYYLDLADADDSHYIAEDLRAAVMAISRRHEREALVIVDNIHLAEELAHRLYLAWREEGQPVELLLQGRFTQRGADRRGRPSPLEELKSTALLLEVMPNDLAGVLQRLIRRVKGNHLITAIPPAVLDQWMEVFGGELIAFSSAVLGKLSKIVHHKYQLTEADAANYIRDEYLENPQHPITLAERENLLAIAACTDWEQLVPAEGLLHPPGTALAVSMRRGLVWQSTHGRFGQFARYKLCHPGMGKLLWAAAKPEKSRLEYACELSQRDPFFAFFVVNRLLQSLTGDRDGAKQVLAAAFSRPDSFERLIEHGMSQMKPHCQRLIDLKVLSGAKLNQKLAACGNLAQAALATPLSQLADFLKYAPTIEPIPKPRSGKLAFAGNIQFSKETMASVASPPLRRRGFAGTSKVPTVSHALTEALADKNNRETLLQAALATPLSQLADFLKYAQTELPTVWQALAEALAKEENRQSLVQSVLATEFNNLIGFMAYVGAALPDVARALKMEMARAFKASGLEHPRLQALLQSPRHICQAERVLSGCRCWSLVKAVACQLVQAADPSVWHVCGVHVKQVTVALRLGNSSGEPAIRRFLARVVTEDWLQSEYHRLPPQLLAKALHFLWAFMPRYVCDHFLSAFPAARADTRIRLLYRAAVPFPAIPNLSLLGASSLFCLDVCGTTQCWPPQAQLDYIVRYFSDVLGEKGLNGSQVLFLAGLREMNRRRPDFIALPASIGERVLTLLKATASSVPNHQLLNAWLLDWLERCAKNDWLLIKDDIPVPEPIRPSNSCGIAAEV